MNYLYGEILLNENYFKDAYCLTSQARVPIPNVSIVCKKVRGNATSAAYFWERSMY